MKRTLLVPGSGLMGFAALAAASGLMSIGEPIPTAPRPTRSPRFKNIRPDDFISRPKRRAGERSKKQYLLKGVRP